MLHHKLQNNPIVKLRFDLRTSEILEEVQHSWSTFSKLPLVSLADFSMGEFGSPWLDPGFFHKDRSSMPRIIYHYNLANEHLLLAGSKYYLLKQYPEAKVFFARARSLCKKISEIFASMHEELGFRRYELLEYSRFTSLRFVKYYYNFDGLVSRPHFDVGLFSAILYSRNVTAEKWANGEWEKIKRSHNEMNVFPGFQIHEASGGKVNPLVHREVLGISEQEGTLISAFIPHPECARFVKRKGYTQTDWANKMELNIFPR